MRTARCMLGSGRDRGFFSVDLLIAFALVLTIFASIYSVQGRWREEASGEGQALRARAACEKLLAAINTVYTNENLEIFLRLPSDFRLLLSENLLLALRSDNTLLASVPVLCGEVVRPFSLGPENLAGTIWVGWRENEISVEGIA
jgi:hypothetical protein